MSEMCARYTQFQDAADLVESCVAAAAPKSKSERDGLRRLVFQSVDLLESLGVVVDRAEVNSALERK